jgi:hypothetical protein
VVYQPVGTPTVLEAVSGQTVVVIVLVRVVKPVGQISTQVVVSVVIVTVGDAILELES